MALILAAVLLTSGIPTDEPPGAVVEGTSTWYCSATSRCTVGYPAGGMYAAAGSELQSPGWRGSFVKVRHGTREVIVQLIDVCLCRGRRIIDLYGKPFSMLAPLERGVIAVTVETIGQVRLPATSTDPWSGLWLRRL